MSIIKKLFGDTSTRAIAGTNKIVQKINDLEKDISPLTDAALKTKTLEFKERIAKGEALDDLLPEAFAVLREATKRTLNMRHFDVQLIGGIMIHQGKITEMRTGEGKTLVATLPLYLNALEGKGAHLVTVNDYLSRRDAVWMAQIFDFLGLSVGVINSEASYIYDPAHKELDENRDEVASFKVVHEFLRPCTRREAYAADITYGTNNEFGFDYLRDNISYREEELRQREYNFAIVDEVDSILIDEARTPLIISSPTQKSENLYVTFARIAEQLKKEEDYTTDEKHRSIALTDAGINRVEKMLGVDNIYTDKGIKSVHHLETAVRAKALFNKDKEYVVKDGEILIVDEFTGRIQPGRRWSEGLHQAIEAKEGVDIKEESRTYASITFQNYFRLYKKLSGMTGTAETSKEEFLKVYNLETIVVPTHRGIQRIDRNDFIFQNEQGKFKALAKKVRDLHVKGQPVLIGTVSIEKNEILSAYLHREGVPHNLLNAKNHEREGEIIAGAGKRGAVTIATNMAGRGVDIKLGGVPFDKEKEEEVKALGGLFVLGTERHEARRIDNQLRGRSGRQGDPGETQFYVSLEDDLMRVFASDIIKRMMVRFDIAEDEPIENRLINRSLETAQTRIEGFHFDSRKHTLEFDDVMNYQRKIIYDKRRKVLLGSTEEVMGVIEQMTVGDEDLAKVIEEKKEKIGRDVFANGARSLSLQTIDMFWMDHLEMMDYLRGSVNLRAYGQRDPLVEYKKDGLKLFKEMERAIDDMIIDTLSKVEATIKPVEAPVVIETREDLSKGSVAKDNKPIVHDGSKVGRNDLCPCGSGKKYKNCHGK
ncbi:MAG: Protein translocase subunit SecA, preprotein translocase subunit SecA [Candidatus Taylorbacteria bacterium]|nr:Protein translocase subunit SecA, preprotein translocase subunit SecA [Candidatus Taylorbacteria bacterium]